jgi:hypothetical protein
MRTDRAFENHMWAELSRNADTLPESSRPYAAALVEAEVGLHAALRMQLHDRLLCFGKLTRAERHDDLALALAAKRRGDQQEAGRRWGDIKYHDEVDAANVALRWMAGLPDLLSRAVESAPPEK